MITDANVILRAFFPDEGGQPQAQAIIHTYVMGAIALMVPSLLPYEVTNAVLQAVRLGRIDDEKANVILSAFEDLGIPTREATPKRMLELARRYNCSAYDAAYLALTEEMGTQLITGDRRLYNAVRPHLSWIVWIEDYR